MLSDKLFSYNTLFPEVKIPAWNPVNMRSMNELAS